MGTYKTMYLQFSAHTLYFKISVHLNFLEWIEDCVSAKSVLKEVVYKEALLHLHAYLQCYLGVLNTILHDTLQSQKGGKCSTNCDSS